jgi:hypothetical protein
MVWAKLQYYKKGPMRKYPKHLLRANIGNLTAVVFHWDTDTVALLHQATMSNKNNADNLQGSQSVAKIHHGAGYTRTEDYLFVKPSLLLPKILL